MPVMEYDSATDKNEMMPHAAMRICLDMIMLREDRNTTYHLRANLKYASQFPKQPQKNTATKGERSGRDK